MSAMHSNPAPLRRAAEPAEPGKTGSRSASPRAGTPESDLHMNKTMRMLSALAAALVLGACSAESNVQHDFDETQYFQQITAKMSLEHGYLRLDYALGVPDQSMRFLLKNQDVAVVSVNEWFMNETDNIHLYYAFCEPGKSGELPEDAWKLAWPDVKPGEKLRNKSHPRRSTLILQPNNSTVIDVPLTFLEHVEPPKRQARYTIALCAQISLNTLQTKSEVFEITVFPQTKDVEIK